MANVRSEFRIGLKDETARGVASINRSLDSLKTKAVALGAGLTAGAGIFGALVTQSANLADELGKTAQRAGVTVEALSGLQYAAKLSDVDIGALSGGLQKLARTMATAAGGGKEAQEAFQALGISFTDSSGKLRQTDVVFAEIADKFSKLPDGATKTALAMQLLGRSGAQMIPLLNAGADGLAQYREEAQRLGLIISTETSKAAEEFNDNLTRIQSALQGISLALTKDVIRGLANLSTEFIRAYTEGEGLLRVFTSLGTAISRALEGSDNEKLGGLLLKEIELEKRIAKIRDNPNIRAGAKTKALAPLKAELQEIQKQAEGLRAVLQPYQYGAEAAPAPAARENIATPILKATEDAAKITAKAEKELARQQRERFSVYKSALSETLSQIEEEARQWEDLDRRRQSAIEANLTPLERQIANLKEINELLGSDNDTYGRAAVDAFNELNPEIDAANEKTKQLESTMASLGATFSSAFEDAIVSASSFSDILEGLAQDILRITTRFFVTDPLANAAKDLLAGGTLGGGIGGFFKGLFSNANGGLYKVAGSGSGERPVAFTAQPGEMVAVGKPGGGGVTVNIIGAPSQPQVRERQSNGRRQIDLIFADAMGSATAAGMLAPVGVRPPLVAR